MKGRPWILMKLSELCPEELIYMYLWFSLQKQRRRLSPRSLLSLKEHLLSPCHLQAQATSQAAVCQHWARGDRCVHLLPLDKKEQYSRHMCTCSHWTRRSRTGVCTCSHWTRRGRTPDTNTPAPTGQEGAEQQTHVHLLPLDKKGQSRRHVCTCSLLHPIWLSTLPRWGCGHEVKDGGGDTKNSGQLGHSPLPTCSLLMPQDKPILNGNECSTSSATVRAGAGQEFYCQVVGNIFQYPFRRKVTLKDTKRLILC